MAEPALSDDHTVAALDTDVRRDLRGLQKDTADSVARHLVAAGSLVEEDPALALEHARFARRRASRIAVVREAAGIAAYHAGEWAEALAELRAARRMGGGPVHLPVMADIERALGRPERAVDIARGTEAAELDTAGRIELAIVGAGARRDLGELDAAVVGLQIPELDPKRREPWSARLFYAYADNLLAAGRESDALQWFVHAADADADGETDAVGRIAALTGEDPDDADDFAFGVEDVDGVAEVAEPAVDGDEPVDEPAADTAADDVTRAEGALDGDLAAAGAVDETRTPDGDGEPADAEPADAGAVEGDGGELDATDVAGGDVDPDDVAADELTATGAPHDVAATEVAADAATATAALDGAAPDGVAADHVVADEVASDDEATAVDGDSADGAAEGSGGALEPVRETGESPESGDGTAR